MPNPFNHNPETAAAYSITVTPSVSLVYSVYLVLKKSFSTALKLFVKLFLCISPVKKFSLIRPLAAPSASDPFKKSK